MISKPRHFVAADSPARRETRQRIAVVFLITCGLCGCQGLNLGGLTTPLAGLSESTSLLDSLTGTAGPPPPASAEDQRALARARKTFEDKKYTVAAGELKKLANRARLTAVGEDAQFLLAESYYRSGKYSYAQDAYDQLLEDYPSTRHVNAVTNRLFRIAQSWLGDRGPVPADGDVKLAGHEESAAAPEPAKLKSNDPTLTLGLLPNFHDRTRPVFDTKGRALQALKSIWLNDPTGPLADDALMKTAEYFLKKRDFVEADRYYKILREEYPKSPHLEKAFLLGSHSKMMSYQGAYYEGNTLDEARKLKESALRLFPDNSQRDRLREEIRDIYREQANRKWQLVEYFERKNKPRAVAINCQQLIAEFPESEFAQRARKRLQSIDPKLLAGIPGFQADAVSRTAAAEEEIAHEPGRLR